MISVITCSVDDARFAALERNYAQVLAGEAHEIIRIPDARSVAEGYNRGRARARGDVLIYSHDDIEILTPGLAAVLRDRLAEYDLLGVAGTNRLVMGKWVAAGPPYLYGQVAHQTPGTSAYDVMIFAAPAPVVGGMQALDGLFLATTRRVAEAVPFDAETFDGFHLYDLDFTFAAYLRGFKLAVCCDIPIVHASYGNFDDVWLRYLERFNRKYDDHLPVPNPPDWVVTRVMARSREEVLEVMRPAHFAQSGAASLT